MVERVDIIDADEVVRNVATLDALIALIGDLTADPQNNTLLQRVKVLAEQIAILVANTDQTEGLLSAINNNIVQFQNVDGLTNAQLRATPLALPTGAATQTTLAAVLAVLQGTLAVTGPLTNSQLRASPLALPTGAATETSMASAASSLSAIAGYVDGLETAIGLTNTALAGSLAVTGPLTNSQLTSAGLATQTTLAAILAAIQAQLDLSTTLWTDDSDVFYVRRDVIDQDSGIYTVAFTTPTGSAATPGAGLRPAANEESLSTETVLYDASFSGTGYTTGDAIMRSVTINQNTTPPLVVASFWLNLTTGLILAGAPTSGHLTKASNNSVVTSSALPTGASTSALQTTGNTSLASILSALQGTVAVSGPLTDTQLRATAVPVSGPLTDTQLRATAVPISASTLPLPSGAATQTTLASVLSALQGTVVVSGPLTDTQLRATAVPISASALPLPSGAATQTTLASVLAALQGTVAVSGPLTDTQLRATAVPVSGPATNAELRASALPVSASALPLPTGAATELTLSDILEVLSGPLAVTGDFGSGGLTDTELRATPVPVSGPLTDTQLRATAVPISASTLPLPTNAASQTTVAAILGALQGTLTVSGALTDTQLRATAVPISASALPLPTGAASQTTLASVLAALQGTVTVSGPLTDTQLRATAVPISASALPLPTGAATQTTLASVLSALQGTVAISAASLPLPTGAATQTTLASVLSALQGTVAVSAASLPLPTGAATQTTLASVLSALQGTVAVSGPLTDTQLRATAVPISASALPLPSGAATSANQTALAGLVGEVQSVPTTNTVLARLKDINTTLAGLVGEVQSVPTSNTVLARLKDINTSINGLILSTRGTSTSRILTTAASVNATVAKSSAGSITRIIGRNNRTSSVYLKIYDKATTPSSSDTPRQTFELPASTVFTIDGACDYGVGISYRITAGRADNDTTIVAIDDVTCLNIDYT